MKKKYEKKIETKKQHANVFHLIQNDKACTCCTNANVFFFHSCTRYKYMKIESVFDDNGKSA